MAAQPRKADPSVVEAKLAKLTPKLAELEAQLEATTDSRKRQKLISKIVTVEEKIKQVETAETFLFDLGFSDFRVRWMDNKAKIQMPESQLQALMEKREVVLEELSKIFDEVLLDLRTR